MNKKVKIPLGEARKYLNELDFEKDNSEKSIKKILYISNIFEIE